MGHRERVLTRGCATQGGYTPLLIAAGTGHAEVVKLLLEACADITAKDNTVSGEGVGDGGLGIRMRGDFRENWLPWSDPRRPARNRPLLSGTDK